MQMVDSRTAALLITSSSIFDDADQRRSFKDVSEDVRGRYEITLQNASEFLHASRAIGKGFTPLGVIQGWSTESMATAALKLVAMGYDYLAIGGTVPLKIEQIRRIVGVTDALPDRIRLHLLGFGKIEELSALEEHHVTSFDTTSPSARFQGRTEELLGPHGDGRTVLLHRDPHSSGYRKQQLSTRPARQP